MKRPVIQNRGGLAIACALLLAAQPAPQPPEPDAPLPEMAAPDEPPPEPVAPAPDPGEPAPDGEREGYRVVRGTPALPGSAPWQIQIITTVKLTQPQLAADKALPDTDRTKKFYEDMADWERDHVCGGVLIDQDWALSAAHCFVNSKDQLARLPMRAVRLGNVDLEYATPMRIERVILHGDYRRTGTKQHDIALIKLARTPQTDPAIASQARPVNMRSARIQGLAIGDELRVTGWGNTGERESGATRDIDGKPLRKSRALMEARQKLVPNRQCEAVASLKKTVNPGILCVVAGDGRMQDSCQGDSGGPLTRRGVLVGLVSGGEGCGTGKPALYTNVAYYADWIDTARKASRPGMMARCLAVTRGGRKALACRA